MNGKEAVPGAEGIQQTKIMRSSESRTEAVACELLTIRGWNVARPPKGNILWKNEYRDYPELLETLTGKGKKGKGGDGYPDFLVVDRETIEPLIVGETKASENDINSAISEADQYGEAFLEGGRSILAAGIAGDKDGLAVRVDKRNGLKWKPVQYRSNPIQWLPTPDETKLLLSDRSLFELQPKVPSNEILAKRGDEINRILRESKIKDEFRPAIIGAFMLAMWHSKGGIRTGAEHVLSDVNRECQKAFISAGKREVAESILVQESNAKLASRAAQICRILRFLNITNLTSEHDYLGQLYEMFFRFTGGNTIGQFFTPRHVTKFAVDLLRVTAKDHVLDLACGTGGFLIAALIRMMAERHYTEAELSTLVKSHLMGFESEPITAALCIVNMLLRGDGKSGVILGDCFLSPKYPKETITVSLGNPPFPHKKTDDPPEKFINRALESLVTRGQLALIVPSSQLVKRDKADWRAKTLKNNSLKAVVSFPAELFQPYAAANTAFIVLEKGIPHAKQTKTFFCRIENDGYTLKKNVRVEREGEQLSKAIAAYHAGDSVPGFCITTAIDSTNTKTEWFPGVFIKSKPHPETELRSEIATLIRSLISFAATHAPELVAFEQLLSSGAIQHRPYRGKLARLKVGSSPDDLQSLFDISYGVSALETKENLPKGVCPVISSAGSDNGCYGLCDLTGIVEYIISAPFVTVPRTGSIGESFVQMWNCGATSDCLVLYPREGTDIADMFIAAATVRLEKWRFDYSRKITPDRISALILNRNQNLKDWIKSSVRSATGLMRETLSTLTVPPDALEKEFNRLADQWRDETGMFSLIQQKAMHPAYQRIIGIGKPALPLILKAIQNRPEHWLWALRAISGEEVATGIGDFKLAVAAWLVWGKRKGYL